MTKGASSRVARRSDPPWGADYMGRALALAQQALGRTSPNPAVGAVIVKDGEVIGEGCTQPPGGPHAEVMALRQAGEESRGAAMYITLEPCCCFGRTPPCTDAIIEGGIVEVHVATLDPNPLVSGKGMGLLEEAGVSTYIGDRENEAKELNEAYMRFITTGRPFVTAKFAMSLDGKLATVSGDSQWISCEESRQLAHRLRRLSDAIMVGVNTIIVDDPQLTARVEGEWEGQPLRVIADSTARTPSSAQVFSQPGVTMVAVTAAAPRDRVRGLEEAGAEVVEISSRGGLVDLGDLLVELGRREITGVLVEGGSTLFGTLFDQGFVDKVVAFIAPIVIGGERARSAVGGKGVERVVEALRLGDIRVERCGEDVMISGHVLAEEDVL